jgi:acyl carrier protein
MTKAEILSKLKEEITKETGLKQEQISDSATFASLGLDSISSVVILDELERQLKLEMNPMLFWDYPTVELLAGHLTSLTSK